MSQPFRRSAAWSVTIRPVRTISRKGQISSSGSSSSCIRTSPTENRQAIRLREIRRGHGHGGEARASPPRRPRPYSEDHGVHESPAAVSRSGILRGHTPATSISTVEVKIWSGPYGDIGRNPSEIPCRVSSDLHEWRNDLGTVSTRDSAKLQCE